MPQYQSPTVKTFLKNLNVQLQSYNSAGACASDLPSNAQDVSSGLGIVTNPANIEACDSSLAVFTSGSGNSAQLTAEMCIVPDGTTAADVEIVFGTVPSFNQASSFNIGFQETVSGPSVGTKVFGTGHQPTSGSTVQIDLDNVNPSDNSNLDFGSSPSQMAGIVVTLEEEPMTIEVDCVSGI